MYCCVVLNFIYLGQSDINLFGWIIRDELGVFISINLTVNLVVWVRE